MWNPNRPRNPDVNEQGALDTNELLNYGSGDDANWVTDADPGFVDAANGDYTFTEDAAVFEQIPGFEAIDFGEIGTDGHVGQSQSPDSVALESLALPADQLTVTLGDEVVTGQLVDGQANVDVPTSGLSRGEHEVTVEYLGDEHYGEGTTTQELTVR